MKRSEIETQLKKELSEVAPSDFNAVWDKCTTPASEEGERVPALVPATAHDGRSARTPSRKATSFAAVAAALLVLLAAILCIVLSGRGGNGFVMPSQSGYFIVDVNPCVQVVYDKSGVVTHAQGLNRDGEELLNGLALDGLTYDRAADALFDACELRGYFTAAREDNAILITASKDTGEKDETITAALNKKLAQKFEEKAMKGVVISNVDNTKGQKDAEKYGISGQKYELIQYYLAIGGSLDEEEYGNVTIRDLYARISALEKNKTDK